MTKQSGFDLLGEERPSFKLNAFCLATFWRSFVQPYGESHNPSSPAKSALQWMCLFFHIIQSVQNLSLSLKCKWFEDAYNNLREAEQQLLNFWPETR